MQKTLGAICISFFAILSTLYGEIVEAPHFSDILKYAKQDTLVILDIDDTLLIPKQTLGTDVWFNYQLNKYKKSGMTDKEALHKALYEWEAVRFITEVKIVEEGTEKIIETMQKQGITIMGLTTQSLVLSTCTPKQLHSLDIDLSKTAPSQNHTYFMNHYGVLYRNGILFTSATPKGKALLKFLDLINYHPKKVVFINDKKTHLLDIEKEVEKEGIAFVGLRYSYSDARTANFNKEIAEVQFHHSSFGHILSDKEAQEFLSKNEKKN